MKKGFRMYHKKSRFRKVRIFPPLAVSILAIVLLSHHTIAGNDAILSPPDPRSVHAIQLEKMEKSPVITDDAREAADLESRAMLFPQGKPQNAINAATSSISDDFIVFGYLQTEDRVYHIRWHALTHIGTLFVGFNGDGSLKSTSPFTNRSSYLKAGGAADAAGVKVILVINSFDDGPGGDIESVMTNPTYRANLVANIKNLLESDGYVHGVNLDLEFSWGSTVRNGISAFFKELRAALPSKYEISVYTNPTFYSSQWDFDATSGITPHIDYMLYSCYTFASGKTAHAVSDFNSALPRMRAYLEDGLPPEKLALAISAYGQRWSNTNTYNGVGTSKTSWGFTDAMYDTTLNPNSGGPFTNHYVRGDEVGWYTWNSGIDYTSTWDDPEAMEYEIRHVLSFQDSTGQWNGRRLRGVGFWSLRWMAETSSFDMVTGSAVSRTRTYPHIYQLCQEILKDPGENHFLIEGYEGLDHRWRDPNESPDTTGDTDGDSSRLIVSSPGGTGAPSRTTNAMQLTFDLEGSGSNRVFFRHEVLASPLATGIPDTNATAAHFDSTTLVDVFFHTASSFPNYQLRMAVLDAERELEVSDPFSLDGTGWRHVSWDLTNAAAVHSRTTSEPAFKNGDGSIDTAGDGARDISFIGFFIEGSGNVNGKIVLDEIGYEHVNPGGLEYTINEFRYEDPALEFVEIHGPAGAFPQGMELRFYNPADATYTAVSLEANAIPDDGGGLGLFVIGDPGTPNVDLSTGFDSSSDDIPDGNPGAIQLYDRDTGCVYDSVVYEAFGGLADLTRKQTHGVTGEGYPWLGQLAGGVDSSGDPYTMGRFPDGRDTQINFEDFGFMTASPGLPNGNRVSQGSVFPFDTAPEGAFQTFQSFSVTDPAASGLPPSPGGGKAYRCVDEVGGGVIGAIGDAALGADGKGYRVTGQIYIPSDAEPAQAVAVGICGRQGTNFFSTTATDHAAYESGYWLIYENAGGVGMNDGRPDHPEVFEFVFATHDNMDPTPVTLLGSQALSATGVTPGSWTTFELKIDPPAPAGNQLLVRINGTDIFTGPIPEGGPISGAFQVGYRENHSGVPEASEGTWVDTIAILRARPIIPPRAILSY